MLIVAVRKRLKPQEKLRIIEERLDQHDAQHKSKDEKIAELEKILAETKQRAETNSDTLDKRNLCGWLIQTTTDSKHSKTKNSRAQPVSKS